jgi:hypothetical protein
MSEDNHQDLTPEQAFRQKALDYHAIPTAGKIAITLTKPADTANDVSSNVVTSPYFMMINMVQQSSLRQACSMQLSYRERT